MKFILFVVIFAVAQAAEKTGSCKDMLQGYLTGQLSSALGAYEEEALRREYKSFTNVIEKSIKEFNENVETKLVDIKNTSNSSAVYTRWGRKTALAVQKLYSQAMQENHMILPMVQQLIYFCLPRNPEWGNYRDGRDGYKAYIYGAEYETSGKGLKLYNHDVPCALCLVRNRSVVKMFLARKTCDEGWKLEYHGYLMAGYYNHNAGTTYKCVDKDPESLQGGHTKNNGYRLSLKV